MAKLSSGQKIQKRLVGNITLLWTLCEVPGEPKENSTQGGHEEGRQLPPDRERQLVDSFAFISALTDDMLRVMAVSIEEDPDKTGMTVRLASNTGDLSYVTQGFKGIARTLEQASLRKRSRVDIQRDLFRQIVLLDEPRILSRLRSSHAKKSQKTRGKPELLPLLNKAVHDESISRYEKHATASMVSIRSSSTRLSQQFSEFEEARGNRSPINVAQSMLIQILIEINSFDVDGLKTVLAMSPTIDPSLKASLPEKMSKIGRYYGIACDLISAARSPEYTIFQRISIKPIEKPHFDMAFIADHLVDFDQAAQRVTRSSQQHLLNAYGSQSISAVRMRFKSRINNCPIPWKVHAEIQLLLFYEQQPHVPRPRFIGSSKSACYLCDLFIRLHGKFCAPRTHGRLYDRWILPGRATSGHLLSVIDRFNAALEAKITRTLSSRARPLPHPNESVLHLRQPWPSSSTLAETHELATIQVMVCPANESPSRDQTESPNTLFHSSSTPLPTTSQDQPVSQVDVENAQPHVHPSEPTEIIRRHSPRHWTSHKLHPPQDTSIIETGPARLHASWDSSTLHRTCEDSTSPRACWIHVHCWPAGESPAAFVDGKFESIDIESLAEDRDTVFECGAALSEKSLALRIRGYMVVVKYTLEDEDAGE